MNARGYLLVSAIIFGLVAIMHGVRLANGWTVQNGPCAVAPQWSWAGLAIAAVLCIWGFASLRR